MHTTCSNRTRLTTVAAHLLAIGALFILPEMVSTLGRPVQLPWQLQAGTCLKAGVYIAVFYINYLLVLPRAIRQGHSMMRPLLWNILVLAGALLLLWAIYRWSEPYWHKVFPRRGAKPPHPSLILWNLKWILRDSVMIVLTIALAVALDMVRRYKVLREKEDERRLAQRQQELSSLKEQLNPHFLFNTLNTIYALIAVNPDTAQEAVHRLSGMLRYVLYEDSAKVELRRETEFVRSYTQLMTLRLGATTRVGLDIDIPPSEEKLEIAPLIFISIIETAFKHCDTGSPQSAVNIRIAATGHEISCMADNTFNPSEHKPEHSGGIGLQNLRRRLKLIYGPNASLSIASDNNHFTVSITIKTSRR